MNTSQNRYDTIEQLIFVKGLKIVSVDVIVDKLSIGLSNHHNLVIPVKKYGALRNASLSQLKDFEIIGGGSGLHWNGLDEDLSLKGFLKDYLEEKIETEKELVLS